jgi:hypothetical protein
MKDEMSLSDTYFLASRARSKLTREATKGDHDLRVLVSHANLLDSLMDSLAEQRARARTQAANEARTVQFVLPTKRQEHPTVATIEEVDSDDSDSDSDCEADESESVVRIDDFDDDDDDDEHVRALDLGARSYRDIGTLGDDEDDEDDGDLPNLTYSSDEDNDYESDEEDAPQSATEVASDDDLFSHKGQLVVLPLSVTA